MYNPQCKNIDFPVGTRVRAAHDTSCTSDLLGTVVDGPGSSYGVTVSFDGAIEHKHYMATEKITAVR